MCVEWGVWQEYLQKVHELCGIGALSVIPFTKKIDFVVLPNILWNGG